MSILINTPAVLHPKQNKQHKNQFAETVPNDISPTLLPSGC